MIDYSMLYKKIEMKQTALIISFILISVIASSQNTLSQGRSQLNFGVGLSAWGVPLYVGFDYGIHQDITLGGELSYRSYNEQWTNNTYNHNIIGFSGNANYHFNTILNLPSKWDFYAGANLAYLIWSSPSNYAGNYHSGLDLGGQIGTRYYLSKRVGLNLEFGGGNAFNGGKFGLTLKM